MRFILGLCLALSVITTFGQRVGVVLSGGGAKGLAHVGVLKALEENEVPIDYLVGTSMGGIIAGCYAAGMSPRQIEEIVLSENFLRWINGGPEEGHNFFFNKNDEHPSFFKLNLSLDSSLNLNMNSSIAPDLSLNFAFAEIFAQPSAIARNNFDSLFVPLRIVTSEIFTQNVLVLKNGNLSDALRATHTIPLFYNPIKVEDKYLFDGGVYNNFPVDVLQKDFNPEVIIGSNVSSKTYEAYPFDEDDNLISKSLLYMLLDKSEPGQVPASGIYIEPNLSGYSAFDFNKARSLIDSGYRQTLRQLKDIKSKIPSISTRQSVEKRRKEFNIKSPELLTDNIRFTGFNSHQRRYISRIFNRKRPLKFYYVKTGYYKLVAEDYFKNIYPSFSFNTTSGRFDLNLTKRPQNDFQVDFGGVIASRNVSNIYLGLSYYYFNRTLTHANINLYVGNFYKSAQAKVRIDLPSLGRMAIEPEATFNAWDYLEGREIALKKAPPTILNRIDRKVGANVAFPLGNKFKLSLHGSYINNFDRYSNSSVLISTDTLDELRLRGGRWGLSIGTSTLNRKQYSNRGRSYYVQGDWYDIKEFLLPGTTSVLTGPIEEKHSWFRVKVAAEQYFKTGIYSSGYLLEGVISNQALFSNYFGTIVNAPGFFPLQDSRTLLLEKFRAFTYLAGGWRNVFSLKKNLDFRLEGYLFKPVTAVIPDVGQEPQLSRKLTNIYFTGTAGLVLHSTIGPISLSLNYYDDAENQLGALLHVGFLLFQKPSLD